MSEIDQQHLELINLLNRLNDAVQNKRQREDIYRIIDNLIAFTRLHFETEERLMAQSGYAYIEFHKEKHKHLMRDALHLKQKLADVGEEEFMDWFKHWPLARILAHIQYADKQVEEHILKSSNKG